MDVIDLCSSCSEEDDDKDESDTATVSQQEPRTKKQCTTNIITLTEEYPINHIDDDCRTSSAGNSNSFKDTSTKKECLLAMNPYLRHRTNHNINTDTSSSTSRALLPTKIETLTATSSLSNPTNANSNSSSSSSGGIISSSSTSYNTNVTRNIPQLPIPRIMNFPKNDITAVATPGIIPLLTQQYCQNDGTTYILASSTNHMLHIQQKDKWSCGYRNLQMLLSAILLPNLSISSMSSLPQQLQQLPSLYDIQVSFEKLWLQGYDPNGAKHYNYRIVDQNQQIGAVEVANYLSYQYHYDTTVIEFIMCHESRSLLIPFCIAYFTKQSYTTQHLPSCPYHIDDHNTRPDSFTSLNMVRDILKSLEQNGGIQCNINDLVIPTCTCPTTVPLYLQWNGHSVTIIGVDVSYQQLLIFDPKYSGSNLLRTLQQNQKQSTTTVTAKQRRRPQQQKIPSVLRLSMSNLLQKDCQIVVVVSTQHPLSQYQLENIKHNNIPSCIAAEDVVLNLRRQQQQQQQQQR